MSSKHIGWGVAFVVIAASPAIAPAAVRDIPGRDLPGAYVATVNEAAQYTFVDIKNVEKSADGAIDAWVYMVEENGQNINGQISPFQAYKIRYDCVAGSMLLDHIDYIDVEFGLIGTLMAPPDFKVWLVNEKPDLAVAYGFHEVCQPGKSTSPRVGQGKPWIALAASVRSKMSQQ